MFLLYIYFNGGVVRTQWAWKYQKTKRHIPKKRIWKHELPTPSKFGDIDSDIDSKNPAEKSRMILSYVVCWPPYHLYGGPKSTYGARSVVIEKVV